MWDETFQFSHKLLHWPLNQRDYFSWHCHVSVRPLSPSLHAVSPFGELFQRCPSSFWGSSSQETAHGGPSGPGIWFQSQFWSLPLQQQKAAAVRINRLIHRCHSASENCWCSFGSTVWSFTSCIFTSPSCSLLCDGWRHITIYYVTIILHRNISTFALATNVHQRQPLVKGVPKYSLLSYQS